MKKVIRFLVFSLTPLVVLIVYAFIKRSVSAIDLFEYDSFAFLLFLPYIVYALFGLIVLLICKKALELTVSTRIPFEYLIGILLVVVSNLYFFVPEIHLPGIFSVVFGSGKPLSGFFIGIYVSLFVILMHRRAKTLKAKKTEPQA